VVLAGLALALVGGGLADAKPKKGAKIEPGKGVAGVHLGMKRGPISVHKDGKVVKVHTVASILGKPQQLYALPREGITDAEKGIYIANYTDDALTVYYGRRGKNGKLDKQRDTYDKVLGVVTFTPRYPGQFAPGDGLSSSKDAGCVPLDKREAPDGGPRRVAECKAEPGNSVEIIYMSAGSPSRAGQTISQLGIFNNLIGTVLYDSLMQGALDDLGCENPQCD
jgi:hypothetical protein